LLTIRVSWSRLHPLVALGYLVAKLMFWNELQLGTAPLLIGIYFFGAVQLFFIGILGEYIGSIHTQVHKRPLVVEKECINFDWPGSSAALRATRLPPAAARRPVACWSSGSGTLAGRGARGVKDGRQILQGPQRLRCGDLGYQEQTPVAARAEDWSAAAERFLPWRQARR
jgi:hypothetical protein